MSDIARVIREERGWCVFRPVDPGPTLYKDNFRTADAAKRWAENNVPALLVKHAATRSA